MKFLEGGTPKTLDEAVTRSLMIGPIKDVRERVYIAIKDYLAQRFGVAMLNHPDVEVVLSQLFEDITRRN